MSLFANNFLKKKSFFISLTFSVLLSTFIYSNLNKFDYLNDLQNIFILSLIILFILSTTIIFFVLKRLYHLYENFKLQKTGQELQKKILLIFASIVMTPTLLIAFFSIFIFDTALSGWFNKKISTAISQSVKIANQYLDEHQSAMRGDILELVNVINSNSNNLSSDKQKFNKFLDEYTLNNNLSEAVVIDSIGNVLAFSQFVFEYTYADLPPKYYNLANNNEIIISKEENSNKLRAFIKLSQFVDAYLLITRFVDERVLSAIESTAIAASDYQSIELKTLDIKISFIVIFILITIILLFTSLIIGLNIANRLLDPITSLIRGAEEVGGGNLDYKIPKSVLSKINIYEIKDLAESFNLMISDLKSNRVDLEYANDQLDKRRKFSESVLSGVYSGVIGLNKNLQINLPNYTASKLLNISIQKDYGKEILKIVPEFKNLISRILKSNQNVIEEKISIIREDKILNLITRIVVQKSDNDIIGYVITFDDVTNLIAAQKMAAWSDIARRIAHEIKNPLTPIRLSSERLISKLKSDRQLDKHLFRQSLTMINKQVDDIDHLVNEFSSFARMPSPKLKKINLFRIIFEYIKPLIPSYTGVSIYLEEPKKNSLIMGDEKQIRQACGNLIKNSYENIISNKIKNGKISILFEVKSNFAIVSIIDNGTGIVKSDISQITEPYFTTKEGGTGLGLAITKKIIEDHNGTILIKSSKKLKRTSVIFQFPLSK